MKKKTVITAGILGVLAVAAGVWFYHPAGKVDQEILSRLEGDMEFHTMMIWMTRSITIMNASGKWLFLQKQMDFLQRNRRH